MRRDNVSRYVTWWFRTLHTTYWYLPRRNLVRWGVTSVFFERGGVWLPTLYIYMYMVKSPSFLVSGLVLHVLKLVVVWLATQIDLRAQTQNITVELVGLCHSLQSHLIPRVSRFKFGDIQGLSLSKSPHFGMHTVCLVLRESEVL